MGQYATAVQFRAFAFQSVAADDAKYDALLLRASRLFDRACETEDDHFAVAGAASARTFYGDGSTYLRLDPYVAGSLTTVTMPTGYEVPDRVELGRDGSFYLVRTFNEDGTLYTDRSILSRPGWLVGVPVTVTARWGYAAIPDDVVHVVIQKAIHLWRTNDPAQQKTADVDEQSKQEPEDWERVAEKYRERRALAFA